MKKALSVLIISFLISPDAFCAFGFSKSATLSSAQVGSVDSTNWPLAIALDGNVQAADADFATVGNGGFAQSSSGYDIRPYSDSACTSALTYELVYYDPTTGKLEMHVNIPTLSHTVDTVIYICFGNSGISTDGSSVSTWNSNFKGVYHLPNGSSLTANDSTGVNNGTLVNTPVATTGEIDGSASFTKTSSQNINLGNDTSLQITGNLTISAWVNITSVGAFTANELISKDKETGGRAFTFDFYNQFGTPIYGSGTDIVPRLYINGGGASDANGNNLIGASVSLAPGTWYFVTGVYNTSGTLDMYVNGSSASPQRTGESTSIPSATANVRIGAREFAANEDYFNGLIDEVRVSAASLSSSWILSDYNSQKPSSNFITWGTKTTLSSGGSCSPPFCGVIQ